MIGIDPELIKLYDEAKMTGSARIKGRWTNERYNCCNTKAPLIEKYRIEITENSSVFYLWGKPAAEYDRTSGTQTVQLPETSPNFSKKLADWFLEKAAQED